MYVCMYVCMYIYIYICINIYISVYRPCEPELRCVEWHGALRHVAHAMRHAPRAFSRAGARSTGGAKRRKPEHGAKEREAGKQVSKGPLHTYSLLHAYSLLHTYYVYCTRARCSRPAAGPTANCARLCMMRAINMSSCCTSVRQLSGRVLISRPLGARGAALGFASKVA